MNAVEALRKDLGLTQAEFAARVGSQQPHISRAERHSQVSRDLAMAIWSKYRRRLGRLGISLEDVILVRRVRPRGPNDDQRTAA